MMDKLCRECGKNVKQIRSTKEFCSTECHDEWWRKARAMAVHMSQLMPCLCEVCREKVTNLGKSDVKRHPPAVKVSRKDTATEETISGP